MESVRPLGEPEKKRIYRFTKNTLLLFGVVLFLYGVWFLISGYIASPDNPSFWFGLFPAYVGFMMILVSIAMKLEWFTDARRFW